MPWQHIFVTGQPGVGKSTLIARVLERLGFQQSTLSSGNACGMAGATTAAAAATARRGSGGGGDSRPVARGFWTDEVRRGRERCGFDVVTLDGRRGPLARVGTARKGESAVGRYVVDVASFESLALPALQPLPAVTRLVVIDEVGKMELCSGGFYPAVLAVLDQPDLLVLGSVPVPRYGRTIPQVEQLKARADVQLVTVSRDNRDKLVDTISQQMKQALAEVAT